MGLLHLLFVLHLILFTFHSVLVLQYLFQQLYNSFGLFWPSEGRYSTKKNTKLANYVMDVQL
jgi:hypothetical protein